MKYSLLAAGSNSGGQLGFGHIQDSHSLQPCLTSSGASFPPSSSKVIQLASGANHSVALVEVAKSDGVTLRKEIWVAGSGSQGQIGASNVGEGEESLTSFKRLNFEKDLQLEALMSKAGSRIKSTVELYWFEPLHVACGWDSSYIALRKRRRKNEQQNEVDQVDSTSHLPQSNDQGQEVEDILISMGTANDFGELGIGQNPASSSQVSTVHLISLPQVIQQPERVTDSAPLEESSASGQLPKLQWIESLEAGPRHVLCLLSQPTPSTSSDSSRSKQSLGYKGMDQEKILVGWGSGRHGQVGTLHSPPSSEVKSNASGSRSRPGRSGPSSVAWKPQIISRWRVSSAQLSKQSRSSRIVVGRDHSAYLLPLQDPSTSSTSSKSLQISSLGSNRLGQCSKFDLSEEEWNPIQVSCCWNSTSILCQRKRSSTSGEQVIQNVQGVWSCGSNAKGQWGAGQGEPLNSGSSSFADLSSVLPSDGSKHIELLVSGSEHSLILVGEEDGTSSEVWGWGRSEHGNLAQGDEKDRFTPVLLWSSELTLTSSQTSCLAENIWAGCGTTSIQIQENSTTDSNLCSPSQAQLVFCKSLPKIELHAHLNGSIRRSTLSELALKKGIDPTKSQIIQGDARTLSDMFAVFDVIHQCTRGAEIIRRISKEMLEDLEEDGVVYVEVRTTPRAHKEENLTLEGYVEAVLGGFADYHQRISRRKGLIPRLILSLDRRDPSAVSLKTVDLAIKWKSVSFESTIGSYSLPLQLLTSVLVQFLLQKGVVGIDLSGDPTKGNWDDWEAALSKARNHGLKITLHAGEVPNREEEMIKMLRFKPDRFGHVCFVSEDCLSILGKLRTPIELCLTSNVLSNSVSSYQSHHLHHHLPSGPLEENVVCLATDDSAVFGSPLSREYALAMQAFGLGELEVRELSRRTLEAVFVEGEELEELQRRFAEAFDSFVK